MHAKMPSLQHSRLHRRSNGRSRRDILVALVVIGLLLVLAAPFLLQMRGTSRRLMCEMRMIAWGEAVREHAAERHHFPGYRNLQAVSPSGERRAAGWVFPTFPFYGDRTEGPSPFQEIYDRYGPEGPVSTRGESPEIWIDDLLCPDGLPIKGNTRAPWLSYVANCGMPDVPAPGPLPPDWPANGVFMNLYLEPLPAPYPVTMQFVQEHDGAESTVLLSENLDARYWTDVSEALTGFVWIDSLVTDSPKRPLRINEFRGKGDGTIRFARPSSGHVGGVNATFCSGATRYLSDQIDYLVFTRMMAPANNQAKLPGTEKPVDEAFR